MNILADASLPALSACFPPPFVLTLYHHNEEVKEGLKGQDILLCRSTLKVDEDLLSAHTLRFVATASSGVDHVDSHFLQSTSLQLLDAKGCNASAVADYVLACLAALQILKPYRQSTAGIIGFGAVGSLVAKRLEALNFHTVFYDPLKKETCGDFQSVSLAEVLSCDVICVHANLHDELPYPSRNLLNSHALSFIKENAILINAARGGIVCEKALQEQDIAFTYCTDVYSNEPAINPRIVELATLCTPHIAGHSVEAKRRAVGILSQKLHTHYNLPLPPGLETSTANSMNLDELWEQPVLKQYNPMHETQALKNALDKKSAFLQLRNEHLRYDFR